MEADKTWAFLTYKLRRQGSCRSFERESEKIHVDCSSRLSVCDMDLQGFGLLDLPDTAS